MQHRRISLVIAATLAAVTAASLAACGSSGKSGATSSSGALSGTISFQTWSLKNATFTPYFTNLVSSFEKAHPGTTVNWIDQPGSGYEDKLQQQAGSNELPDVVNLTDSFAYELGKAGVLVDLKAADPATLAEYVPGAVAGFSFDGIQGTFSYPWYLGTDLSWWNTAQLKQAGIDSVPTTNDQFLADALTAAKNSQGKVQLISSVPDISIFQDANVPIYQNGKFTFNTSQAVGILQKYVDLFKAGAMPQDALNANYAGNTKLFTQSKVAFTTSTSTFASQLATDAPTLVPNVEVTKRLAAPPLFLQGLSVAKDSKNPRLALAFAQYATDTDNQIAFVKLAQGFLPGTIAANADPSKFTDSSSSPLMKQAVQLAAQEMKSAKDTTIVQYTATMSQYVDQQFALALQGSISAQDALNKSVQFCNQNL